MYSAKVQGLILVFLMTSSNSSLYFKQNLSWVITDVFCQYELYLWKKIIVEALLYSVKVQGLILVVLITSSKRSLYLWKKIIHSWGSTVFCQSAGVKIVAPLRTKDKTVFLIISSKSSLYLWKEILVEALLYFAKKQGFKIVAHFTKDKIIN